MEESKKLLKVGSRKSELALIQTNCVIASLKEMYPDKSFEIVGMSTLGDEVLDRALPQIGEKSLFTATLEKALAEGKVDALVHSLKDMPTALPDGLVVAAVTAREDPRDAVIMSGKQSMMSLDDLPAGAVVGTSSLRRRSQLAKTHPHLTVSSIRGNLQTRLAKLDSGLYDALVLAAAGVNRMGWDHRISQVLSEDEMLYAVGQGSLAVESRLKDASAYAVLGDAASTLRCVAERALLAELCAGCSAPVAVSTEHIPGKLSLTAAVLSLDGLTVLQDTMETQLIPKTGEKEKLYCGVVGNFDGVSAAYELGVNLARSLKDRGASEIIATAKKENENAK